MDRSGRGGEDSSESLDAIVGAIRQQKRPKPMALLRDHDEMMAELRNLDANAFAGHLLDNVTDEVALEGLDGITVQALKLRLEIRPNFEIEGFEDIASALWNQMKRSKSFTFHLQPVPRADLVPYAWDQYRDERGSAFEPLHAPEDIYPYCPVEDKDKGIRGSCEHYTTRKDISHIVRRMSYVQAIQLFGNRLVIVAAQILREKTLLGSNYKKFEGLSIVQYCMMERIARSRYNGEITRGKISLTCMKIPPKTLFYQRKMLLKGKLVQRQNGSLKFANCKCPAQVTVFHLPRFYRRVETQASLNARTIFSMLNNSQDNCIPVEFVVSKYGKHTLRGVQHQFPTLLETAWFTKAEEKEDTETEVDPKKKAKPVKPRTVRVLKLKITDIAVQTQLIKKSLDGQPPEEENEEGGGAEQEDGEENINLTSANSYSDIRVLRKAHFSINFSDCYYLFHTLIRAGTAGLKLSDFGFLSLTPLECRSASRFLVRHNSCKEGMVKLHKQKAFTFTLNSFASQAPRINLALQYNFSAALLDLATIRQLEEERKLKRKKRSKTSTVPSIPDADTNIHSTSSFIFSDSLPPSTHIEIDLKPNLRVIEETSPNVKQKVKTSPKKKLSGKEVVSPTMHRLETSLKPMPQNIFNEPPPPPTAVTTMPSLCLVQAPEVEEAPIAIATTPEVTEKSNDEAEANEEQILTIPIGDTNFLSNEPQEFDDDYLEQYDEPEQTSKKTDPVDDEIRSRLNRQRVDWNEHDDTFILTAYISTNLFIPKCNFSKIFVFNSPQMRDLLLKKTKGNSNKTAPAIRRRIQFLMHQKPYFNRYIGLMGAAVRDEYLYETYVKDYLHPPQLKIYINPPDDALENVMKYLYKKFRGDDMIIVDTKATVGELEAILFLRQLKRTEYYWKAMIFSIFCPMWNQQPDRKKLKEMWRKHTMANSNDVNATNASIENNERSQEEEVIMMENENGDSMLVEGDGEEKKTPEEYFTEYCLKFLKFLLKQLKIVFNNMLMFGCLGNRKEFQLISFDPNLINFGAVGSSSNICFSSRECSTETEIRIWGARCLILDYVMCGDTSKVLDKSVVQGTKLPLEKAASSLTSAKVLVCSKRTGLLVLSRYNLRQFVTGLTTSSFDETAEFLSYIDEASNVDSLACLSVGVLFGIVELSDYFKSSINVIESIFSLNDEWAPVYDGIQDQELPRESPTKSKKKGRKRKLSCSSFENEPPLDPEHVKRQRFTEEDEEDIEDLMECIEDVERNMFVQRTQLNVGLEEGDNYIGSSTNALRLLRMRLNQAGVKMPREKFTGYVEKDFFTINLPSLEFVLPRRNGLNHRIAGMSQPYPIGGERLFELRSALVELVYHNVARIDAAGENHVPHIDSYVHKYAILFQLINLSGRVGVSGTFLMTKFENKSLMKGLRFLIDSKLVFSVGIVERRFVSYNNVNDWIIPIRSQKGGCVVGHVIVRPWITSLGAISWPTVNRLFVSILGQLQKPALLLNELCDALSPTLSPVEVVILIEALAKLKYLTVYKVHDVETTMFSPHPKCKTKIEYNVDTFMDTENVYVATSPYTTFLFAQLYQSIKQAGAKRSPTVEKTKIRGDKYLLTKRKRRRRKENFVTVDKETSIV